MSASGFTIDGPASTVAHRDDALFRNLLDNMYDGVYFVDRDRRIQYWNKGAHRITGFTGDEVAGRCCADNLLMHVGNDGEQLCNGHCPLAATLVDGQVRETEIYAHHKEGHRIPVLVRVAPIHDERGEVTGAVEIFSDNTAKQAIQQRVEELQELALLDHLTQLANRRYTEIDLKSKFDEWKRYQWPLGVMMIDIDYFKRVNDRYGHEAGDQVLKMTARSLSSNARPFDVVGRWGGEEFLVILTNIAEQDCRVAAERFRALIESASLTYDGETIGVTVSIGATMALPGDTQQSLVKRADDHLYQSKTNGRNRVTF